MEMNIPKTKEVVFPYAYVMGQSGQDGQTFTIMAVAVTRFCEACAFKSTDEDTARDIGQIVAVYVWRKRQVDSTFLDGSKPLRPFFRRCVKNIRWKYSRGRKRAEAIYQMFMEARLEELDLWMNPGTAQDVSDMEGAIGRAREAMPRKRKIVVKMKIDGGMKNTEIAEATKTTPSAVRKLLKEANKDFAKALEPYDVIREIDAQRNGLNLIGSEDV